MHGQHPQITRGQQGETPPQRGGRGSKLTLTRRGPLRINSDMASPNDKRLCFQVSSSGRLAAVNPVRTKDGPTALIRTPAGP